jgi:hypothetical protein
MREGLQVSATSRQPRLRHSMTQPRTACYWRLNSNQTASGEPGAVQPACLHVPSQGLRNAQGQSAGPSNRAAGVPSP